MVRTIQKKKSRQELRQGKSPWKSGPGFELPESLTIKQLWFLLSILLSVTLIAFLPALFNGFVLWDDPEYTYENPILKDFNYVKVFSSASYLSNYHPLTLLWLHWETILFPNGDPNLYNGFSPFWFHLNNLLLHLLNTILVFFVIYELLGRKDWKAAAITSLLFGIHPLHVESVAWVSELKDVLYTAFFLGSAWLYIRYLKTKKLRILAAAFALFVFSCLAKGQAVTLPLLFLLFDYYLARKYDKTAVLEKIPFFAVSIIFGIIAIKAQAAGSSIDLTFSPFNSFFFACYGLLVYLWKFLLPIHLSGFYPYPVDPVKPLPGYFYIFPVLVIAILFIVYKTLRYSKSYLFGFLFFVLAISVTLRFIPLGDSIIADRYTYIPYIGLGFIIGRLYSKFDRIQAWRGIAGGVLVLVIIIFASLTWQRVKVWKDSFSFWGNVVNNYPDYWRSYSNLGKAYLRAGDYPKALENFNYACERDREITPVPFMLRGGLYVDYLNEFDKGIADFLMVLSFPDNNNPFQIEARNDLGLAYNKQGNFRNAVNVLDEAIRLDPKHAVSYFLKGVALKGLKKYTDAETEFNYAIKLFPGFTDAYLKRGILYTDNMGEYDKGIADFRKVLELEPGNKDASINIGICYLRKKRLNEAIEIFTRELKHNPDDGMLYYLRSTAYIGENNFGLAYLDMTKATQLGIIIPDQELNEIQAKAKIIR
jgi:tetratricopeptide (TPR) repeat protein